jgi:FkbM family methyltransferase
LGHIDSLELLQLAKQAELKVIYDIGANVGTWSVLAKSIIPSASLHAFEPLPAHHDGFVNNVRGLDNVTLHRIALGATNTEAVLHVTNYTDASSMLQPTEISSSCGVAEVAQFSVPLRRLDDYRVEQGLPWPDLIKLDVQGFELEVLKGASECLRAAKAVISEVSFVSFYKHQCLFHDVVGHLAGVGLFVRSFSVETALGAELGQTDMLVMRS